MKTVSEKLATRLHKEFPELGIKPHTELVRQRPDPYWPKGEPQVKWCRENWTENGRYNEVFSFSSMRDCLNGELEIIQHESSREVRVKT